MRSARRPACPLPAPRPSLLATAALALVAAAPLLAQGADARFHPDEVEVVEPCCPSLDAAALPNKAFVTEREGPSHSLYDPATMAAMKEEAVESPEAPPGRDVGFFADDEGPRFEELKSLPDKRLKPRQRFDGMDQVDAGHEGLIFLPPDTIVAASGNRVLEAANVALRLSDRSGNQLAVQSLNNFFGQSYPPILFDPQVFYDRLSDRFFLLAVSFEESPKRSLIHLAVSRSGEPASLAAPQDWCSYRINAKRAGAWADFPGLGMNENYAVVSTNHFKFRDFSFHRVNIFAFDKRAMVDNAGSCPSFKTWKFAAPTDAEGVTAFTVQPAEHYTENGIQGTPLFLVSTHVVFFASDRYVLWRLTGNAGQSPTLSRVNLVSQEEYSLPPNSPQRNGVELDTADHRMMQVAFRDGEIWAVHTTGCTLGGGADNQSCIRAVRITPNDAGGQVTFEETYGANRSFFWMPGVAVNRKGDVGVAFQMGREGQFFGFAVNGKPANRATFDKAKRVVPGGCGLADVDGGGRNRTGDYVGIQTDPADDLSYWVAGEYPGTVPGQGCDWHTRVGLVRE